MMDGKTTLCDFLHNKKSKSKHVYEIKKPCLEKYYQKESATSRLFGVQFLIAIMYKKSNNEIPNVISKKLLGKYRSPRPGKNTGIKIKI